MITSTGNSQIKNIIQLNGKAKARKEQNLFVAEGIKMFEEAPKGWISKVFLSETASKKEALIRKAAQLPHEIVDDSVFRQMSDTMTPQGILTVLHKPSYRMEDIFREDKPLIMVLEDLQDPGNLGTIFRTAEGAGVNGILLTKNCVDVTNPKVIRSTMGSIYRMPYLYVESVRSLRPYFNEHKIITYAAHLKGDAFYDQRDYHQGTAFFIGNEGNGLTEEASSEAEVLIKIPMNGQLESLNAAMAAGILMYEAARQRRN